MKYKINDPVRIESLGANGRVLEVKGWWVFKEYYCAYWGSVEEPVYRGWFGAHTLNKRDV